MKRYEETGTHKIDTWIGMGPVQYMLLLFSC